MNKFVEPEVRGDDVLDSIIHVAVCDDDDAARRTYVAHIDQVGSKPGVEFAIHQYESGNQLLFDYDEANYVPDIVLVAAEMSALDGASTAGKLRERGFDGVIIFCAETAGSVFEAFDVNAFNYVLKGSSNEAERFETVFSKAVAHIAKAKLECMLVRGPSGHRSIPIRSIRYIESRKHTCIVHYGRAESCAFVSSLLRVEEGLKSHRFVRIHRSYLVNCDYIEGYTFKTCTLRDGTELPVGRKRYPDLRRAMEASCIFGA